MKKIEAIIREEKLEELKEALEKQTVITGMTVSQVLGFGHQKGQKSYVRGQEIITTLLPKVSVTFVVNDEDVEAVIDFIIDICQTDEVGDGKIFVVPVEEVVRIRTRERGSKAV
jgi:nitrogen regulatory protein P-II 1